jgi:hypothetical protein
MNKIAIFAIAIGLCVVIIVIGLTNYLGNTPNESAKPIINVKVTSFNLTGYDNPVGVVWNDKFLLTYANNGTTDVYNTTINFSTNSPFEMNRTIGFFDSAWPHYYVGEFLMGTEYPLGAISVNETKEFIGYISNFLGDSSKVHGFAFTATLKSNETLLDQATVMIPALV